MARTTPAFFALAALLACAGGASALNAPALRAASKGTHHAVIIAGSHGFQNYRHHADVCHAFQILSKNGVPTENIVMMYYDDVANSWQNPFKGHMFNEPSTSAKPGVDVYANCQKDYSGNQVNKQTFTAVLTGDSKTAGGKVLTSGKDDRVFVYFADHGGTGLIAMPSGGYMYAKDLQGALTTMHSKNMYKELVFYMEACESGSMFQGFDLTSLNIYATTAANARESSWGTYCPPQDSVYFNGQQKTINSCLGDLYSVNWMQDADKEAAHNAMGTETLMAQYDLVKQETAKSHVQQFGAVAAIASEPIGNYEADLNGQADNRTAARLRAAPRRALLADTELDLKTRSAVNQRDASLVGAFHAYLGAAGASADVAADPARRARFAAELVAMVRGREQVDALFADLVQTYALDASVDAVPLARVHVECKRAFDEAVRAGKCGANADGSLSYAAEYALKHSAHALRACAAEGGEFTPRMAAKIAQLSC